MEFAAYWPTLLIIAASVFFGIRSGRASGARLREIGRTFPFLTYGSWPRWVVLAFFVAIFLMMIGGPLRYWLAIGPLPQGAY